MADKPISPDSDDSWENLAKDLFGVEFDSPPVPSDDLDDELLNDDFLNDQDEPDVADESADVEGAGEQEESLAEAEEIESVAVTFSASEEVEAVAPVAKRPPDGDLDALLDFSQPYGEEESEAVEEPETAEQKSSEAETKPDLFQKLAAESGEIEDDEIEDEEAVEFAESDDDELENEDESDEQLDTDDFWDVLEQFAPEELGTPHIDHGQTRGGKPPRDPEIGMISEAPKNERKGNASFEVGFDTDSDFGLGVLEDVETDEDDDTDDVESADSGDVSGTGEESEEEKRPKRRRRRRRRGGRRKKPATADTDENASEAAADADAGEVQFDEAELSDEEQDDETEVSRSADSSRYKNIPTWSEAIELIVDRKPKPSSENRGRRGNRSEPKNRKRGGRRRRPRKSSS